jgi:hypothetical protein
VNSVGGDKQHTPSWHLITCRMVTNTDHKTIDARSCSFVYMANAITSPMVQD